MSGLLVMDTKTFNNGRSQFYETGLIRKVLEYTGMHYCNGLPIPNRIEAPIGTCENGPEAKRD